jgi:2-oxoisovalerate dehydrogenase E1 component alpha subunit
VSERASAYGMPGVTVDGNDVLACYEAMKEAVDRARSGGGPTLIECMTYRFHPHTSDDDDRTYRSREEVDEAKRNDPIILFGRYMQELGALKEGQEDEIRAEIKSQIDEEVERAWGAADPEPGSAMRHVYADDGPSEDGSEQLENASSEVSPTLEDTTEEQR